MSRYHKFSYLTQNFFISKAPFFHYLLLNNVQCLSIRGGHFKFTSVHSEHGLIFRILAGQNPSLQFFTHGKRLKKTVLLSTKISGPKLWEVFDKLINVVIPSVNDLRTLKFRRSKCSRVYNWRINKYFDWEEVSPFLSDRLLKRNVFYPLFVGITLLRVQQHSAWNESYLRMLRCPFMFYKYRVPFSPDDSATIY